MQVSDLQELVNRLKENKNMQVETTTLGRALGDSADKVAMSLGREVLNKPVIVSTQQDNVQIIDMTSGFVVSFSDMEEAVEKVLKTYSKESGTRPKMMASAEKTEKIYKDVLTQDMSGMTVARQLFEFKQVMYKSGSVEDRMALVEKTIKVLDVHKTTCAEPGDVEKVSRAQYKLSKIINHLSNKKLAPGQVPSVYEIAIWEWVN
jgi:tRNA A37 threonylcarbamoyltransferase TsaD